MTTDSLSFLTALLLHRLPLKYHPGGLVGILLFWKTCVNQHITWPQSIFGIYTNCMFLRYGYRILCVGTVVQPGIYAGGCSCFPPLPSPPLPSP